MRKFKILLITLILSLNIFSIRGIAQVTDTTSILIPTTTARLIALDLLEGDEAKQRVLVLEESLEIQQEIISEQDSLIDIYAKKIYLNQLTVDLLQEQVDNYELSQKQLSASLKSQKRKTSWWTAGTFTAIAGIVATFLLVGK